MKSIILGVFALGASLSLLNAGVVYEIETTDHEQSPPKVESIQMAAEGRHLKMGIGSGRSSNQQSSNIYRGRNSGRGGGPSGTMYYDDENKKLVMVDGNEGFSIDQDSFSNSPMGAPKSPSTGGAAPPGIPAGIWNMLPDDKKAEIRKQMQQSGHGGLPPGNSNGQPAQVKERIVDTGKTGKTSDGKKYRVWRRYEGGQLKSEFKILDWKDVPDGTNVRDLMIGFSSFMEGIQKSAMGQNFDSPSDNLFNYMEQVNGFPYEGTEFENNRRVATFRVTKMTKKKLSAKDIRPDPNIQITDMGAMMSGAAAGMSDLFNQMGQGNPHAGSSIDREAMIRMQQERQNSRSRNGGASSSRAAASDKAEESSNN